MLKLIFSWRCRHNDRSLSSGLMCSFKSAATRKYFTEVRSSFEVLLELQHAATSRSFSPFNLWLIGEERVVNQMRTRLHPPIELRLRHPHRLPQ